MRIGVQLSKRGTGDGPPLPAPGGAWVWYILLLTPGVLVSLLAQSAYPLLLNVRRPMGFLLGIFLFPTVLHILSIVLKLPNDGAWWLRPVYICASLALVLLGLLLFLNGRLDKSRGSEVTTTVVRKTVIRGRTTRYHLWATSWRRGRREEDFNIGLREFNRARVGKTVTVELHSGFFGLPWRGDVLPE